MLWQPIAAGHVTGVSGVATARGCAVSRSATGIYVVRLDQAVDETECIILSALIGVAGTYEWVHTSDTVKTLHTLAVAPDALTATAPSAATATAITTPYAAFPSPTYDQSEALGTADLANVCRDHINSLITDVADLRTKLAAAIADLGSLRTKVTTGTPLDVDFSFAVIQIAP